MAKLTVGILLGLVLGLYLDSTASGGPGQLISQIEVALRNLFAF